MKNKENPRKERKYTLFVDLRIGVALHSEAVRKMLDWVMAVEQWLVREWREILKMTIMKKRIENWNWDSYRKSNVPFWFRKMYYLVFLLIDFERYWIDFSEVDRLFNKYTKNASK